MYCEPAMVLAQVGGIGLHLKDSIVLKKNARKVLNSLLPSSSFEFKTTNNYLNTPFEVLDWLIWG